jgi:hypothetical protein
MFEKQKEMSRPVKPLWALVAILFLMASIATLIYSLTSDSRSLGRLSIAVIIISSHVLIKR